MDRVSLLWADRRAKLSLESPVSLSEALDPFLVLPSGEAEIHVFFYENSKN